MGWVWLRCRKQKGAGKGSRQDGSVAHIGLSLAALKTGRATLNSLLFKVLGLAPDYRREMHIPCPSLALRRHTVTSCHCFGLGCGCTAALFLSGAVECPLSTAAVLYGSAWPYTVIVRVARSGCMSDPPVQPDYHAHSGNLLLRPIRNRHDNSPVAVAIGNWRFTGREGVNLKLHLKRCATCGYTNQTNLVTVPVKIQLPSGSKSLQLKDPAKNRRKAVFSFLGMRLRADIKDLKRIFD